MRGKPVVATGEFGRRISEALGLDGAISIRLNFRRDELITYDASVIADDGQVHRILRVLEDTKESGFQWSEYPTPVELNGRPLLFVLEIPKAISGIQREAIQRSWQALVHGTGLAEIPFAVLDQGVKLRLVTSDDAETLKAIEREVQP